MSPLKIKSQITKRLLEIEGAYKMSVINALSFGESSFTSQAKNRHRKKLSGPVINPKNKVFLRAVENRSSLNKRCT
jgi:hypothetical protein